MSTIQAVRRACTTWLMPSLLLLLLAPLESCKKAVPAVLMREEPLTLRIRAAPSYRYASDPVCRQRILSVRMRAQASSDSARYLFHPDSSVERQVRECAYAWDEERRKTFEQVAALELQRLADAYMNIPEFHDEQRLADAAGKLGPVAGIYATPELGRFKYAWQFKAHILPDEATQPDKSPGVLLGFVVVGQEDGEALTQYYTDLGLAWGINCVFLDISSATYTATIVHPNLVEDTKIQTPCRNLHGKVSSTRTTLDVVRRKFDTMTGDSIVAAARFTEDTQGRTTLGFRCLDEWCEMGLPGFSARTDRYCDWPELTGLGITCSSRREAEVPAWYDEQRIEEMTASGWSLSSLRAVIIPEPRIDERDADYYDKGNANPKKIATIYLNQTPPKWNRWYWYGLRIGQNDLELTREGNVWLYHVTSVTKPLAAGEVAIPWGVAGPHMHYDAPLPGTMRWRYTVRDPGGWGPCGQTCCPGT